MLEPYYIEIQIVKDIMKAIRKHNNDDVEKLMKDVKRVNMITFDTNDNNTCQQTLLICACRFNNYGIVDILLKYGCDPNKSVNEESPLLYTIANCRVEIIELLVNNGAHYKHINRLSKKTIVRAPYSKLTNLDVQKYNRYISLDVFFELTKNNCNNLKEYIKYINNFKLKFTKITCREPLCNFDSMYNHMILLLWYSKHKNNQLGEDILKQRIIPLLFI